MGFLLVFKTLAVSSDTQNAGNSNLVVCAPYLFPTLSSRSLLLLTTAYPLCFLLYSLFRSRFFLTKRCMEGQFLVVASQKQINHSGWRVFPKKPFLESCSV